MKQKNIQKNILNQSFPNNVEAERAVLGAILIDSSKIKDVAQIISSSDFYNESHVKIFDAMIDLKSKNIPIDLLTLFDYLKSKGNLLKEVGESSYLTYLTELVPTSQNVAYYAELVKIKADERHLCEVFTSLDHRLRSGSISSKQAGEHVLKAISKNRPSTGSLVKLTSWGEIVGSKEPEIEFLIEDLIPTSCLLILAGKPKLGKSLLVLLFAISIGLGVSLWEKKVLKGGILFVSTEDGIVRLNKRIWKMLGNPDKYEPDFHFHIGECILTDFKVLEALTTKILEHKPRLVVLDPLINLIRGRDLNSGEDMNVVLRPLQNICKQTGTTILVIHHARKSGSEDPLDVVQGSTTITGVADGVMILKNLHGSDDKLATLEIILKDTELPKTMVLKLRENLKWDVEGELEAVSGKNIEDEIIKSLRDEDELTIQNLVQITGYEYKPIYRCLLKLEEDKKVKFEKIGRSHTKVYSLESEWKTKMENESNNISNCNHTKINNSESSFSNILEYGQRNGIMESEFIKHSESCDCDECVINS